MKDPKSIDFPINIIVTVYSKNGTEIVTLSESISEVKSYYAFPESGWEGIDQYKGQLKNGTYLYHLDIKAVNGDFLHNDVHKLTIIK